MLRNIELAALPSTLQLCLQTADRCGGLAKTLHSGAYIGLNYHPSEAAAEYTGVDVISLLALGLLACAAASDNVVQVTDAAVQLLSTGLSRSEMRA